jgi:hypothetical protein
MKTNLNHLAAFAALAFVATPAVAQNAADPAMTTGDQVEHEREDDNDFPWGLLGLAGLAGLLGRKRDHDGRDHRTGTNNTNR